MENNRESEKDPILTIIQKIKDRIIDPKTISKEERQQCVEILYFDGWSESAIAQILNRSDKTIQRDFQDIQKKNALNPSPDFVREIVGRFVTTSDVREARLIRLSRSNEGSLSERAQAESTLPGK